MKKPFAVSSAIRSDLKSEKLDGRVNVCAPAIPSSVNVCVTALESQRVPMSVTPKLSGNTVASKRSMDNRLKGKCRSLVKVKPESRPCPNPNEGWAALLKGAKALLIRTSPTFGVSVKPSSEYVGKSVKGATLSKSIVTLVCARAGSAGLPPQKPSSVSVNNLRILSVFVVVPF